MTKFAQFVYSKVSNELDWWQGLLDIVTGLDSGIQVKGPDRQPTTVAEQFADRTSAGRAQFYLDFGNNVVYRMERCYNNNQRSDQVLMFDNSGSRSNAWWNGSFDVDQIATRQVFVAYIKSENFVWFGITAWNGNLSGINRAASRLTVGDNVYAKSVSNNNPISGDFIGSNSTAARFLTFFTYAETAGTLSYINKAIFISGGVKQFETEDILTCTTIPLFSTLSFNGRNYLAIGTNALLELKPEDEESES
jgi:hypothetical protein